MAYWLLKSEPGCYSIDDLKNADKQTEHWDGVRNYQARNFMRDGMQVGDLAFFYHSNCNPPGIAGICKVVSKPYPDHTAFDPEDRHYDPKSDPDNPRWMMVDVKFVKKFDKLVSLPELKQQAELAQMRILQKGNRLSITPIESDEWQTILELADT